MATRALQTTLYVLYAALQLIFSDGVSGVRLYRICVVYDNLQLRF